MPCQVDPFRKQLFLIDAQGRSSRVSNSTPFSIDLSNKLTVGSCRSLDVRPRLVVQRRAGCNTNGRWARTGLSGDGHSVEMRDFTYSAYRKLLKAYLRAGYTLISYQQYLENPPATFVILRHDVDKRPANSLRTAILEHELKVTGSYYFRIGPQSLQPGYIRRIADLGHEIGYHYEELSLEKGDYCRALKLFEANVETLRQYYPVKTMCMHGSPLSSWDNKSLWERFDYRQYGILAEPYFDLDFRRMLYLTDTGRTWKEESSNLRDTVQTGIQHGMRSTFDIITSLENDELPGRIMQNIHPQRWNDNSVLWLEELVSQNIKNVAKTFIGRLR